MELLFRLSPTFANYRIIVRAGAPRLAFRRTTGCRFRRPSRNNENETDETTKTTDSVLRETRMEKNGVGSEPRGQVGVSNKHKAGRLRQFARVSFSLFSFPPPPPLFFVRSFLFAFSTDWPFRLSRPRRPHPAPRPSCHRRRVHTFADN